MRYLVGILACGLFSFSPASDWADAPAPTPAVSFSPARIDFGVVPSNTQCTQIVTVTLDRRVFPSHLPTLVPDYGSQANVSLFARFDGPDFIRVVYRVALNAYFRIGPFQDHLSLVDDTKRSSSYPLGTPVENTGVNVIGESVHGLEGPTQPVDFGNVKVGESKLKSLTIGFYTPPMVRLTPRREAGPVSFPQPPAFLSGSVALGGASVTSNSPYFTAQKSTVVGLNASIRQTCIWQTWTATFKSHLPLGRIDADLQFKTQDGYCATVPVTAEVVGPFQPEPHATRKH